MKPSPIPYAGEAVAVREARGLRATLGAFAPSTQSLHVHEYASFSVLVAGRGVDRCRQESYAQPPLTAVFHPSDTPHANDIGPGGVLGLALELTTTWLNAHGLTERALGGYRVVSPAAEARLLCLSLVGAAWRGGPSLGADLETHALEFLELLLPTAGPGDSPAPRWLSRGEEFLRTHFRSPVGLSEAAREAGVHPIHFARVFRRRHGCPVRAYLRSLRVAAAGELIVGGSQPLAQVARGAGFADQPHLTRCFSRVLGLSPGALRRLRLVAGPGPVDRSGKV